MNFNTATPISSEITSVDFRFLSSQDIERLSAKQIVNPVTFDGLAAKLTPNPGGLYDPALGADRDLNQSCTTCGLDYRYCPGHIGHISLPTPVFHPLFFDQILRLLRSSCVFCHKLRMSRVKVNEFVCLLNLVQHGLLPEAKELAEMAPKKLKDIRYESDGSEAEEGEEEEGEGEDEEKESPSQLMERRERFVRAAIKRNHAKKADWNKVMTEAVSEARREIVKRIFAEMTKGKICNNCRAPGITYRADGYSKIFEKNLSEKVRNLVHQKGYQRPNLFLPSKSSEKRSKDPDAMDVDEGIEDVEAGGNSQTQQERISYAPANNSTGQRIVTTLEAYNLLSEMFKNEAELLTHLYRPAASSVRKHGAVTPDMFFIKTLVVPPTCFRPLAMSDGDARESPQNKLYAKILQICLQVRDNSDRLANAEDGQQKADSLRYLIGNFVTLQEAVNSLFDSSKNPVQGAAARSNEDGIKQKLEKKEGLFRKNMMGKRVNFAARSVISPDPMIETSEIGVPLVFAQKLTYPEPVTDHNFERLRQAVINGPETYPGASQVEMENGAIIDLSKKTVKERTAIAAQLNSPSANLVGVNNGRNKKVHRHLRDGDFVIMNRQPTLHKPSMMGHKVRVLLKEKTIRMHYANCNTYNADFDGDEMNMHLPQNDIARAEAQEIASTDYQYLVATSGKPLRGLIQDHLVMGVWMTNRDTMFTREQYQQLLYSCLRPEEQDNVWGGRIVTDYPAIMKPRALWTGKQVISTIMRNICPKDLPGLNLTSKAKINGKSWGEGNEEGQVLFQDGELLIGILDKSQFGPTEFGFVHSVYEVFGPRVAGKLLSVLGRVFTEFLRMRAFTCSMDDLLLTPEGNAARKEKLKNAAEVGQEVAIKYVSLDDETYSEAELKRRLEEVLREDKQGGLDLLTNSRTKDFTSSVISTCLPKHLVKPFPKNHMQAMTLSGAKGSDVNSSQISCLLGQQTLEGKRVPVMVSGKTLPCFKPFDTNVRAGGYIADRFLTGIRPQEYYFHCMAGREGLIDTAVKTSRSGYLQRCLIKGMEGLKVAYDHTVRDADGSLIQFLYGEDSLDVIKQKHLSDYKFLIENAKAIKHNLRMTDEEDMPPPLQVIWNNTNAREYMEGALAQYREYPDDPNVAEPVMTHFPPSSNLGSVSEKFYEEFQNYISKNPHGYITSKKRLKKKDILPGQCKINRREFRNLMYLKYMNSLVDPGEAVGIVAGQSIGEPSTQMTLNTFHLAGHATKNVTLGIPRLREIVMTASASIATPSMTLTLQEHVTEEQAEIFRKEISRLALSELIDKVSVTEKTSKGSGGSVKRFVIRLDFYTKKEYDDEYNATVDDLIRTLKGPFIKRLTGTIQKEIKRKGGKAGGDDALPEIGKGQAENDREFASGRGDDDDADDDISDDEGDGDATDAKDRAKKAQAVSYEEPDEDERPVEDSDSSDDDMTDEGITDMSGTEDNQYKSASSRKAIAKAREETIKEMYKHVSKFDFDDKNGEWCEVTLDFAEESTPKLLLISIVESVCRATLIHEKEGIKSVTRMSSSELSQADQKAGKRKLSTEGVNYREMWEYADYFIEPNDMYSNDIVAVLRHYGVEAARNVIVSEMKAVFGGHGISVDSRHLSLIADMMTRGGGFIPFNRTGMTSSTSPLMKMSFETTCNFLKEATLFGSRDKLETPSSRIVTGQLSGVGTGGFDVLVDWDAINAA